MRRLSFLVAVSALFVATPQAADAQSYATQVWDQLQAVYGVAVQDGDYTLRNYIMGKLNDDESDSWTFPFEANSEYLITAACDNDCGDIDVTVTDSDRDVVAKDTETDDNPVVHVYTTDGGRYTVKVKMYECSAEPCYWGFGIFKK